MSLMLDQTEQQHATRRPWGATIRGLPLGLVAALQFLTIMPPLVRRPFTPTELGRAVGWFPVVGILLGAMLAGAQLGLSLLFPQAVAAALILVAWVLATGALHVEGFLDCCDGLFGGRTPEARLRIMRDERVGAFAVIGGLLLLLVKYSCLASLAVGTSALLLAPTVGRWGMAFAVIGFPYARAEGLGRALKDNAGWRQAAFGTVAVVTAASLAAGWVGMVALVVAVLTIGVMAAFVLRRVPGFTGDLYGALCELLETTTLLTCVAGEMR